MLVKEEQIKPKSCRKKGMRKIMQEINEIYTYNRTEKVIKIRSKLLERLIVGQIFSQHGYE
jgi:hypothetical protein